MPNTARITIDLPLPDGTDVTDERVTQALDSLADVMLVQAEDGLYSHGSPDAASDDNEHVLDWANQRPGLSVTFVDLAYASPGSVQGWIESGHFSTVEEDAALNGDQP